MLDSSSGYSTGQPDIQTVFGRISRQMVRLWFEDLPDFWPHGALADNYGVLRFDGLSERALVFINKQGIISAVRVMGINRRPDLIACATQLKKMKPATC